MLKLLLGTDWISNRDAILELIAQDVAAEKGGRILMVPELISHDMERRLCKAAGDTASRFAEVLSFTRLARRVADSVGYAAVECLDNGGRVIAMASAARQMHSKLKAYASVETRPEFLTGLVEAVDEFKRCYITAADLKAASLQANGSLAQKLEELSLLLEAYDGICQRGKRDPRDQMSWLLEQLQESTYAEDHIFYIDGFPDFTRQHTAIIEYLIRASADVTVSLNCDRPGSELLAFERAGQTAAELIRCAKRWGVPVEIIHISGRCDNLAVVRQRLYQGGIETRNLHGHLRAYRTETVYQECTAVAEEILSLIQKGVRYRDVGVVCGDVLVYRTAMNLIFHRCGIPLYFSGTESVLEKPVISTVVAALDAALGGFEQRDVLRYLKSVLSPLDPEICDQVERYAILWSVSGNRWHKQWDQHPLGLGEIWTEDAAAQLVVLNEARSRALNPLLHLRNNFIAAKNLRSQVMALYGFFEEIGLSQRLSQLAEEMDAQGDNRTAQILNQIWEILLTALEQMYDTLGESIWDTETFARLFKLLLGQYDVGTIPPTMDAVTAGPANAMRCHQVKHLFVIGALEGSLPGYGSTSGVLTDQERQSLRNFGIYLAEGAMEHIQTEFAEIYGVFCGAQESVSISCPAGQPSFIYRRLSMLAGGEREINASLGAALVDRQEAGAYLARCNAESSANELGLLKEYADALRSRNHTLGRISAENVEKLYGNALYLSASQIDRQAECRLSYFLRYGLRAKEQKPAQIDPAEFGTYVHAVLEQTARRIMELGGFSQVSLDKTQQIAMEYAASYVKERFGQIDSERNAYLFRRNGKELSLIVEELWNELQSSSFSPVDFEVAFGDGGKLPAIEIFGKKMNAYLRGFVDRVDACELNGKQYFRVVDYKTGKKDFYYCDIYNGLGLQMLLYLFSLEQYGQTLLGDEPIPAGVQYFPARVPFVSSDGMLTDEEADAARMKLWKRKGLLLRDEGVLQAMEPGDVPKRLSYTRKKDGAITGDLADREQFQMLKMYVFRLLQKMVDEIASGCVAPNPYTRGASHNACTFCPYGAVCHEATVEERRNYKATSAERFWEDIQKEVKSNG